MTLRLACLMGLSLGCTPAYFEVQSCPRGEQRADGHCLPTPSLVFLRCIEAFRTTTVEHDRGKGFAAGASASGHGSVELAHEQRDRERREYTGVGEPQMELAITECRRQEQAERAGQLAQAWAAATKASVEAQASQREAVALRRELERTADALERAKRRAEQQDAAKPFAELPQVEPDLAASEPDDAPSPGTDEAFDATDEPTQ